MDDIIKDIKTELKQVRSNWPPFKREHEGYAVILEEMDELWDEIKKKKPSKDLLREEAIQIAAMGIKFIEDLC